MAPHRESFWNIGSERYLLIPIAAIAIAVLVYAFWQHYLRWRLGREEDRFDRPWERLKGLLIYGLGNARVTNEVFPGTMHLLIYGGMLVLFIGTITDASNYYLRTIFNISFLQGSLYLGYSFTLDAAGGFVMVGLLFAVYRRYARKPARLDNMRDDGIILGGLALMVASGFLVEGFRIAADEMTEHPDWSIWSPVGFVLALGLKGWGVSEGLLLVLHRAFWWVHALGSQCLIAYTLYSKLGHIFLSPVNIFFRKLQPGGTLQGIPDFETAEVLGAGTIWDLTWKQLLDLDACVRCGRCQDNCPAHLVGKALSPKALIMDLKGQMLDASSSPVWRVHNGTGAAACADTAPIIGDAITEEAIWSCTTCGACERACPVFAEHISKVVDIRRNLVLMQGKMPEMVQDVLMNLEHRGHPWLGTRNTRTDLIEELGITTLEGDETVDLLYWVGCAGTLEGRTRKVTSSMVRLLRAAGVSFAVLGSQEGCCGDPARRMGNEYLYQTMAQRNIEVLSSHRIKRIVTHCPHCFNTLGNEYPQLGGDFEVIHHSQLLALLVHQGRLRLNGISDQMVACHDSCYLGRHNNEYAAPRDALKAIPGVQLTEMTLSGQGSFCCGAGGGRIWMEDAVGTRISEMRAEQILATGASTVAVSCPFCLQMLEAGISVKDLSNIVQNRTNKGCFRIVGTGFRMSVLAAQNCIVDPDQGVSNVPRPIGRY